MQVLATAKTQYTLLPGGVVVVVKELLMLFASSSSASRHPACPSAVPTTTIATFHFLMMPSGCFRGRCKLTQIADKVAAVHDDWNGQSTHEDLSAIG
jgi:hypothetical protein